MDSTEDARELIYEAIREKDLEEVERLLRKCGANAVTPENRKRSKPVRNIFKTTGLGSLCVMMMQEQTGDAVQSILDRMPD